MELGGHQGRRTKASGSGWGMQEESLGSAERALGSGRWTLKPWQKAYSNELKSSHADSRQAWPGGHSAARPR